MAFPSKDGGKHTNLDSAKRADAQHMAKQPQAAPSDPNQAQGGPPPIEQDPEAMQCVQILQQKGYTADDVEKAMGGGEQQEQGGYQEGY
jgi:hypothetical protein